jgi:tRNA A64-2'-O-ribosylphosphate transferase
MPDALSKTVPIWCEVINRAIQRRYGSSTFQDQPHRLYTPASSVSAQEHHQIEIRLEGWSQLLAESSYAIPRLRAPLKPIWITPDTTLLAKLPPPDQCLVVVCVCASRRVELGMDRRSAGYTYVQGSADDHELWSMVMKSCHPLAEIFDDFRSGLNTRALLATTITAIASPAE